MVKESIMKEIEAEFSGNSDVNSCDAITNIFYRCIEQVLDITEVSVGDSQRYRVVRPKLLRSLNNALREVRNEIDVQVTNSRTGEGQSSGHTDLVL